MGASSVSADLGGLIDGVYEAEVVPDHWPAALADMAKLVDGAFERAAAMTKVLDLLRLPAAVLRENRTLFAATWRSHLCEELGHARWRLLHGFSSSRPARSMPSEETRMSLE
jgi:hypothetical protein